MKPIKLVMENFMSYKGNAVIDFSTFSENLFVIKGETGSGKSTIFDAICFALYGKVSNERRNTKKLLCQAVENEFYNNSNKLSSYVEFTFEHQGITYTITRTPEYTYKNRKGKDDIKDETVVLSYTADGEIKTIENKRAVDKAITDTILKISFEQFKQIAMISQGEFKKILAPGKSDKAAENDTAERTKILRSVFNTDKYNEISKKLEEKRQNADKEKNIKASELMGYCKAIKSGNPQSESFSILSEDIANYSTSADLINIEKISEEISKIIEEDKALSLERKKKIDELNSALDELKEEKTLSENNNKLLEDFENCKKEKQQLENKKKEIDDIIKKIEKQKKALKINDSEYKSVKSAESDIEKTEKLISDKNGLLQIAVNELNDAKTAMNNAIEREAKAKKYASAVDIILKDIPNYKKRDELNNRIAVLNKENGENDNSIGVINDKIVSGNKEVEKIDKFIKENENLSVELSELNNKETGLKKLYDEIDEIIKNRISSYNRFVSEADNALKTAEEKISAYRKADEEYIRKDEILSMNRAGILAGKLKEGEPCPVCGSENHPHKAVIDESHKDITEAYVDSLFKAAEKARAEKENAVTKSETARINRDNAENTLREKALNALKSEYYEFNADNEISTEKLIEEIKLEEKAITRKKEEIASEIEGKTKVKSELDTAVSELSELKANIDLNRNALEGLKNKKADIEKEISALKGQLDGIGTLKFRDENTANNRIERLRGLQEWINNSITETRAKYEEKNNAVTEIRSAITENNNHLEECKKKYEQYKNSFIERLAVNGFSDEQEFVDSIADEKSIEENEKKVKEYEKSEIENIAQYNKLQKNCEGIKATDIKVLDGEIKERSEEYNTVVAEYHRLEGIISENNNMLKKIQDNSLGFEKAMKNAKICEKVYLLVNGKNKKGEANAKITFEQYVQSSGFKTIIDTANCRLLEMTGNKFRLALNDNISGSKDSFLDLMIEYNEPTSTDGKWKRRSIHDISGGESFKASLALALGLSDMVSSENGGIQMDALFIDEGFGTLSKNAIDETMSVIIGLADTNKYVGIISHRDEVQEKIPMKIHVKKDKDDCSSLSVSYDV